MHQGSTESTISTIININSGCAVSSIKASPVSSNWRVSSNIKRRDVVGCWADNEKDHQVPVDRDVYGYHDDLRAHKNADFRNELEFESSQSRLHYSNYT